MESNFAVSTPGSQIQIESASWRDFSEIRDLEKICFPVDAWPMLDMIGVLTFPNVERFKLVLDGYIVGFIAGDVKRFEKVGWIATICVHPDHRGYGFGKMLLDLCEERMNMPRVKLSVRSSNSAAINMYKEAGYNKVGQLLKYYKDGENAIVMEKSI